MYLQSWKFSVLLLVFMRTFPGKCLRKFPGLGMSLWFWIPTDQCYKDSGRRAGVHWGGLAKTHLSWGEWSGELWGQKGLSTEIGVGAQEMAGGSVMGLFPTTLDVLSKGTKWGFVNFGTVDVWGWITLCCGKAVLCLEDYLIASLASTY